MKQNIAEAMKIIQQKSERFEWIEFTYSYNSYGLRGDFFSEEDYWDYVGYNASYGVKNKKYIIFCENYQISDTYTACSQEEALGMFMMDYPNVCYKDINYVDITY